ncbi:MAG: dynamin family protein [Phascolarctobacterium sp.]|uniref:dynamin family protein n=1 Tax=Phascolarctobacterium sp. TaxID=2049039 RepID=UPI0026DAA777|nr:dynamin family protein [Phascolarctobacterium sp.]MDO4921343.1 dynamin family protein [Phascolarctobacterium sp.]
MMNMAEVKKRFSQNVDELLTLPFVQKDEACMKALLDLQRDLANDFFTVVVLGEFKRGKSTFINALLGEDLLPTDVLPETATINAIMYNEKPELQIVMQDGTVQQGRAERSFLERYSARNLDSDVNQIKYIKIGYPFKLLENRTVIVDTPGVSDLNEQRCEVTYRFIPKANTVLFLLDANSPLKKTEKDFIDTKLLSQGIDNIIFVVNKYDSVDEEEDADFLENLQLHMMRAFSENEHQLKTLQLYPLSAKMALQGILQNNAALIEASGINEVKEALRRCVQEGRVEELKLQRYKGRMQELLLSLNGGLENQRALKAADVDKLREAKQNLQEMLREQQENKDHIRSYAEVEKKNIYAMADKSLQYFYKKFEDKIIDDVQFYKGLDFKDYIEQRISKTIQRELENWVACYAPNVDVLLRALEKEIARGISYRFNQKLLLNANFGGTMQGNTRGFNITARDVSNSSVKAGAIAAGGAGLMMLIGGPVLMPFISMAAFPFLQRKFLENQLASAKEQVIPAIQEQMAEYILNLREHIHKYIDEKCAVIIKNSEYAYDDILASLEERIDAEISDKETASSDLAAEVQRLTVQIGEVQKYLQKLQEV